MAQLYATPGIKHAAWHTAERASDGVPQVRLGLRILTMGPIYPIGVDYRGHGPVFAVAFLLPFIGGIALDVWLHTVPFFITIGSIVGFLAFVATLLFYRKDFRD